MRAEAEKEIEILQRKLNTLMDSIPGGVLVHHAKTGKILQVSEGLLSMFGCEEQVFRDHYFNNFDVLIFKADRMAVKDLINTQLEFMDHVEVSFRVRGLMNETKYMEYRGRKILEQDDEPVFYGVLTDVSDRVAVQQQLQARNEELYLETQRYKLLQEATDEITFEYDFDTDSAIFHYPGLGEQEKLFSNFMKDELMKTLVYEEDWEDSISQLKELLKNPQKKIYEFRFADAKPKKVNWYRAYLASFASGDGKVFKIVGSFKNITKEVKEREALSKKANVDFMTGLLNKNAMEKQVKEKLSQKASKAFRALLVIDADKFKRINDSLGHLAGDAVIQYIAKQIKKNFAQDDLVGRIGGDEFMVFLEADSRDEAIEKVVKVNKAVREPFAVEGINLQMSCSIGMVFEPENGTDYETIFSAADQALYDVKKNGRDHYALRVIK